MTRTNTPWGWDPTLEDAMVHSESAYMDWRDIIEGRKAVPDEHDETAEIVADAIAQERAAVVAWLRGQLVPGLSPDEKRLLNWVFSRIARGEHCRKEGA